MWIVDFSSETDNPLKEQPFVPITHFCYNDMLPQLEFPWHSHKTEFEVAFILEGSGTIIINEKETPVKTGDICVTPPGIYHHYSCPQDGNMNYFVFRFDSGDDAPGSMQHFFSTLGPATVSGSAYLSYFRECTDLLLNLHIINGGRSDSRIQTICLSMLQIVRMLMETSALEIRTDSDFSMNDVLVYLTEHCNEHITLQSLGRKFCISPSHLSRLFSKAYNRSPIDYLINARILRATEYLGKTNLSINKIAVLVGYDNPFYFNNLFQKRVGCSPTEYRARLINHEVQRPSRDIFPEGDSDQ